MESNTHNNRKNGITLAVVVVALVIAITSYHELTPTVVPVTSQTTNQSVSAPETQAVAPSSNTSSTASNPATNPVTTTPPPATNKQYSYKDGTYTATGAYMSPGGEDQVTVTLTLAHDVITSVNVTPGAQDRTSQRYQDRFISGYKQYVVGKNIASVNVGVVSGSSLTPIGFNDALTQIKAQAKA